MSFLIVPFAAEHFRQIEVQKAQRAWIEHNAPALAAGPHLDHAAARHRPSVDQHGVRLARPGRGYAWALLADDSGPHMHRITRAVRQFLDRAPWRRVEMTVEAGFESGLRWARLLGFECETPRPMRGFAPHGADCYLFSRVR